MYRKNDGFFFDDSVVGSFKVLKFFWGDQF